MTQQLVKKGQQISLKIKRLGINGEGIGYYKKLIIFVPGALPKEDATATITNVTPKFAEGTLQSVKKAAKDRVVPPCPVYETCGGCQLQHLAYKAQLDFKKDLLKQALNKFKPVNYQNYELRKTIGMENPWNYRNKAQFQLRQIDGQVEAGLYQADSHQLVPIDNCLVQQPATTKVMNTLVDLLNDYQKDGIVKRSRLNALLRDLTLYEKEFRKQAERSFHTLIENTSKWTTSKLSEAGLDVKSITAVDKQIIQGAIKRPGEDGLVHNRRNFHKKKKWFAQLMNNYQKLFLLCKMFKIKKPL